VQKTRSLATEVEGSPSIADISAESFRYYTLASSLLRPIISACQYVGRALSTLLGWRL